MKPNKIQPHRSYQTIWNSIITTFKTKCHTSRIEKFDYYIVWTSIAVSCLRRMCEVHIKNWMRLWKFHRKSSWFSTSPAHITKYTENTNTMRQQHNTHLFYMTPRRNRRNEYTTYTKPTQTFNNIPKHTNCIIWNWIFTCEMHTNIYIIIHVENIQSENKWLLQSWRTQNWILLRYFQKMCIHFEWYDKHSLVLLISK